jgi:hypothetical protein
MVNTVARTVNAANAAILLQIAESKNKTIIRQLTTISGQKMIDKFNTWKNAVDVAKRLGQKTPPMPLELRLPTRTTKRTKIRL